MALPIPRTVRLGPDEIPGAGLWNQFAETVERRSMLSAGNGVQSKNSVAGRLMSALVGPRVKQTIPAVIAAAGPAAETDMDLYPYPHYWAQRLKLGAPDTVTIAGTDYRIPTWANDGPPVLATNRAERAMKSHFISVGVDIELYMEPGGIFWFDRVKAVLIPVILERDGFTSMGDATHTCDATYTPTKLNGAPIYLPGTTTQVTGLSPIYQRVPNFETAPALRGEIFSNGTEYELWNTDEFLIYDECP